MNDDGSGQTRLTNNAADDTSPYLSPDGNKVLFTTRRHGWGEIYEMNTDGTGLIRLTNDGSDDLSPVPSPDGTRIAFSSNRAGGDYDVWVMNRDGSGLRRVTYNQLGDYGPTWKLDGSKIAFHTFYGGNYQPEVTVINADSSNQTQLTNSPGGNAIQSWGSNNRITFRSNRDGNAEVYVMDENGGNQSRLTFNSAYDGDPTWSPDAQQIGFVSNRDGNSEIYKINADGTGVTRLTNNAFEDLSPKWGPAPGTPIPPVLTINDVTVNEGNSGTTTATFTLTLSAAGTEPVTVAYTTADGTATAGSDYTGQSGVVTFNPGTTTQTIDVIVQSDMLDEANETFFVDLSGATNATIGDAHGTGTITDDDATPVLSINSVVVPEGDGGTTDAVFTVRLSEASGRTVTVNYSAVSGTATSGSDYQATAGNLSFAPGQTEKTITVPVIGDARDEDDETYTVKLSSRSYDSDGAGAQSGHRPLLSTGGYAGNMGHSQTGSRRTHVPGCDRASGYAHIRGGAELFQ